MKERGPVVLEREIPVHGSFNDHPTSARQRNCNPDPRPGTYAEEQELVRVIYIRDPQFQGDSPEPLRDALARHLSMKSATIVHLITVGINVLNPLRRPRR